MAPRIHPSAVVEPGAELASTAEVGPFCLVGAHAVLGEGVRLLSHVVVEGRTTIGPGTVVFPFASLGHPPQDLKYKGEPSTLEIGANNRIREHVTMNPGTEGGGMVTRVGSGGLFMVGCHVAHDCQVGDRVILANNATLAGHVVVGDHAILGGLCAIQQWVRIGAHAMIGGMSGVEADVIPFGLVKGDRAHLAGLNLVGLERRGFPKEDVNGLRAAFKALFVGDGTLAERMEAVRATYPENLLVADILAFLGDRSARPLTLPR